MSQTAHTSLLCYLTGAPDLDDSLRRDLAELLPAPGLQLGLQVDLADPPETERYALVHRDGEIRRIDDPLSRDVNAGDPEELVEFLEWAHARLPARRYVLLLWGHGTGSVDPTAHEDTVHCDAGKSLLIDGVTEDGITLVELAAIIPRVRRIFGEHLPLVVADACYMGSFEFALQVARFSRVLVASEYIMPYEGIPYPVLLEGLSDPGWESASVSRRVVEAMGHRRDSQPFFVSAWDLSRFDLVDEAFTSLSAQLARRPVEQLHALRQRCQPVAFGAGAETEARVDLVHLIAQIESAEGDAARDLARALRARLLACRLAHAHGGEVLDALVSPPPGDCPRLTGLSILFPPPRGEILDLADRYVETQPAWHRVLVRHLDLPAIFVGDAHWSGRRQGGPPPVFPPASKIEFEVRLHNAGLAHAAEAVEVLADDQPLVSIEPIPPGDERCAVVTLTAPTPSAPLQPYRTELTLRHGKERTTFAALNYLVRTPRAPVGLLLYDRSDSDESWLARLDRSAIDVLRASVMGAARPREVLDAWDRFAIIVPSVNFAPADELWAYLEARAATDASVCFIGADVAYLIDQRPQESRHRWMQLLGYLEWREPTLGSEEVSLRWGENTAVATAAQLAYVDDLTPAPDAEIWIRYGDRALATRRVADDRVGAIFGAHPSALAPFLPDLLIRTLSGD